MQVPFGNLYKQYLGLQAEIDTAIKNTITKSSFIRGENVETFESKYSHLNIGLQCISCANGTDALYIALKALGVTLNDEVIVPDMTWISSSQTISQAGGTPVFVDVDCNSYTLDPHQIEQAITDKTKGIIVVHLYGNVADMEKICQIADTHGLWVIEDCAQAHFAKTSGKLVGSFGDVATFSFYPGKNLGAMGDAGAILTKHEDLALWMRKFSRHGGLNKGDHEIEGINSRLDGLQAAILNIKLEHIFDWNKMRRQIANKYIEAFRHLAPLTIPTNLEHIEHVWHLFVLQVEERQHFISFLEAQGIQTSINYPRALHQLPCYSGWKHADESFPIASSLARRGVALPIYPELTNSEVIHVIDTVHLWSEQV